MESKFLQMKFHNGYDPDLVIGSDTDYGIIDLDGFDGDNMDVTMTEYPFDGAKVKLKRMASRPLSIHFGHRASSETSIHDSILGFFTPYKPGKLTVTRENITRAIDYIPTSTQDKQDNYFKVVEYEIQLNGPSGYFEDPDYNLFDMATWTGGFKLRTKMPFKLRHRDERIKTIHNVGHATTPVWVQFKGPANSPKIINVTSGKAIQVATTIGQGEVLNIKTDQNNPQILITLADGTVKNGYPYLTRESELKFFLELGDNIMQYQTADNTLINEVSVRYKNLYMGI